MPPPSSMTFLPPLSSCPPATRHGPSQPSWPFFNPPCSFQRPAKELSLKLSMLHKCSRSLASSLGSSTRVDREQRRRSFLPPPRGRAATFDTSHRHRAATGWFGLLALRRDDGRLFAITIHSDRCKCFAELFLFAFGERRLRRLAPFPAAISLPGEEGDMEGALPFDCRTPGDSGGGGCPKAEVRRRELAAPMGGQRRRQKWRYDNSSAVVAFHDVNDGYK